MSPLRRRIAYAQNFIRDPRLVDRLLDRAEIVANDLVVEIGPGRGVITTRLAARCRQVLAVEKDPVLVERLRRDLPDTGNVALFATDFLTFPLPCSRYKVFANIPFNITAAIVGKLTSGTSPPADAFLVVQREAAERFLGIPRATLIGVLLHPWFEPAVLHRFRPRDFAPPPGVEVVLLRLRRRESPLVADADAALYGDLVSFIFTAWQPTVRDALALALPKQDIAAIERQSGVSLSRPPSELPAVSWVALTAAYRTLAGDRVTAIRGARRRLEQQQSGLEKEHRTRTPQRWGRARSG